MAGSRLAQRLLGSFLPKAFLRLRANCGHPLQGLPSESQFAAPATRRAS